MTTADTVRAILGAPVTGIQLVLYMSMLSATGYQAGADSQSDAAQFGIRVATCLIPIGFALVSLIPLLFLPYSKAREDELGAYSVGRRVPVDDDPVAAV